MDPGVIQAVAQHGEAHAHDNIGGASRDNRFMGAGSLERQMGGAIRFDRDKARLEIGQLADGWAIATDNRGSLLPATIQ